MAAGSTPTTPPRPSKKAAKPAYKIPSKSSPVTGGGISKSKTFSATRKTTMKIVPATFQKNDDSRGIKIGDLTGNYYLVRGNCDSKWNRIIQDATAPFCFAGQKLTVNMQAEPRHLSVKVCESAEPFGLIPFARSLA